MLCLRKHPAPHAGRNAAGPLRISRRNLVAIEQLETRSLLSAVYPTNDEQYFVELVNRARANPTAEASRYGIDLNEGLSPGTISPAAKQPLAINPYITDAARKHSNYMIQVDRFDHDGIGDGNPGSRMSAAGYSFTGNWSWGENIAYRGTTGSLPPIKSLAATLHQDLFVDTAVTNRGHRIDLLNPNFRETGAGLATGVFTSNGTNFNALMVTQDFAASGSSVFLTGVAYKDNISADNFYTPGEGLANITVTAKRKSDAKEFKTTTWSSGGYSLALPAGAYVVTASGPGLGATILDNNILISDKNVKRDFLAGQNGSVAASGASIGVYRDGVFWLDANGDGKWNAGDRASAFGQPGDVPVTGDWNGDGKTDLGVYRDHVFYLDLNNSGTFDSGDGVYPFGKKGDVPVVGDWTGDGKTDIGVYRGNTFWLDQSGNREWGPGDVNFPFGIAGDQPVAGDWNGIGKSSVGVYRNGIFYLDSNNNRAWNLGIDRKIFFGQTGDRALIHDLNADGKSDVAVFRGITFYLDTNGNGVWDNQDRAMNFGLSTDQTILGVWI